MLISQPAKRVRLRLCIGKLGHCAAVAPFEVFIPPFDCIKIAAVIDMGSEKKALTVVDSADGESWGVGLPIDTDELRGTAN